MHVLVVTVVHVPTDARILHRQIAALRADGVDVSYAAPWSVTATTPPADLDTFDLPRASGRARLPAVRAARDVIAAHGPRADLVLLHDPELLAAVRGVRTLPPVVWDVHEDTAAALADKPWLPGVVAPLARRAVGWLEGWAERNVHLILAEHAYADRFTRPHPVVPNHPVVPDAVEPPGDDRVVYLGRFSRGRGAAELLALGERLAPRVTVEIIGPADDDVAPALREAVGRGSVRWTGFLPNDVALPRLSGALAGLSLLRDTPNYRASMPTKVHEYLGWGVPAITTPLPLAAGFIEQHDAGIVVPFGDVDAVVAAVRRLRDEPETRLAMAARGREAVWAHHSWRVTAPEFTSLLRGWARS